MKKLFEGVFQADNKILTKNLVPGKRVYGEKLIKIRGVEYREWIPFRSKLCGAIKNGLSELPLHEGGKVLYLGIAEGTTAGHISDIVGNSGVVFGVDVSGRTMKKLLRVCEERKNIVPILADANKPEEYKEYLEGFEVDVLYQDVSQKEQVKIFIKNAELFLRSSGKGLLALKAKSISSTEQASKIFALAEKEIGKKFKIIQRINLKPFEKDHIFYLLEKR